MFVMGAVLSLGVLTNAQECTGAEDCGPQEGYPYYYDWDFDPTPMIRLTKAAALTTAIPTLLYYKYDRIDYEATNGEEKDYTDISLTAEDYHSEKTEVWYEIAMVATGLWGSAAVFNTLALIGFPKFLAAFWLKHVISNFNLAAFIYIGYLLSTISFGWKHWTKFVLYAGIIFALERFFGVAAIQHVRPQSWVYLDT